MINETEKTTTNAIPTLQLTSDIFFGIVLEDIAVCQEVIRILTGVELEIIDVKSQYSVLQMNNHSVRIDIWAEDKCRNQIGIEMHPQSNEDRIRRNRYNISSMDIKSLEKGKTYAEAHNIYGIYITKADFLKTKKGINKVVRTIQNTDTSIPNGIEEYYISLSCEGDTKEQTELLKYLKDCEGVVSNKYFPNLVRRVRWLKEESEGQEVMCEIMDGILKRGIEIGEKRGEERGESRGERRGVARGKILGAIDMMRELEYLDTTIEHKLIEKYHISQEKARKYMCVK
ncbi:MAG: PD-(D/E)XK nuclease family transposase [Eubacteriales bacterium]